MERLFGLLDIKVCELLTALDCINNVAKFVSGSFVLRGNPFLFQTVAGSEVKWDVMLRENSPESFFTSYFYFLIFSCDCFP